MIDAQAKRQILVLALCLAHEHRLVGDKYAAMRRLEECRLLRTREIIPFWF